MLWFSASFKASVLNHSTPLDVASNLSIKAHGVLVVVSLRYFDVLLS